MSVHFKHYRSGKIYAIKYEFESVGDSIPRHSHGTELAHNIVVLRGRLLLDVEGFKPVELLATQIYDFDWMQAHRIIAMEPNSAALHLLLNGMPKGYDTLPPSELEGTFK